VGQRVAKQVGLGERIAQSFAQLCRHPVAGRL
jgi:hypothetical protein